MNNRCWNNVLLKRWVFDRELVGYKAKWANTHAATTPTEFECTRDTNPSGQHANASATQKQKQTPPHRTNPSGSPSFVLALATALLQTMPPSTSDHARFALWTNMPSTQMSTENIIATFRRLQLSAPWRNASDCVSAMHYPFMGLFHVNSLGHHTFQGV